MQQLPNYKLILNIEKIAKALWIPKEHAIHEFRDGRVISRFSEHWASKLYDFKKCDNSNEEGYDGFIEHKLLGKTKIGVRSLTKHGIKFQKSSDIGSGRDCDTEKLIKAIESVDFEIVIDITKSPTIILVPVKAVVLIDMIKNELLKCTGLSKNKFYKLIFGINSTDDLYFNKIITLKQE